jgi:hypothetical protein
MMLISLVLNSAHRRRVALGGFLLVLFCLLPATFLLHSHQVITIPQYRFWSSSSHRDNDCLDIHLNSTDLLTRAQIYVISLPRRTDRRRDMEILREYLGLNWTYTDGIEADDDRVTRTLYQVWKYRANLTLNDVREDKKSKISVPFEWPRDLYERAASASDLDSMGSELWNSNSFLHHTPSNATLTCAQGDFDLVTLKKELPRHLILTPARIACWMAHIQVIRHIANGEDEIGVILEDDVNTEKNVKDRLTGVTEYLPIDWDVLFLGDYALSVYGRMFMCSTCF